MRWLVLCVLLFGRDAAARVVMEPPIAHECRSGKTWQEVTACLAKAAGPATVVRQTANARLVRVVKMANGRAYDGALVLYVSRNGQWKLNGLWPSYGDGVEILGFAQVTVGRHAGYRIDVGRTLPITTTMGGVSTVPALWRTKHAVFCGGDYHACADVVTLCEVLVQGKVLYLFHGQLSVTADNELALIGDRTKAGPECNTSPERVFLGWM